MTRCRPLFDGTFNDLSWGKFDGEVGVGLSFLRGDLFLVNTYMIIKKRIFTQEM